MNEELKIIIRAVTDTAKKNIREVNKEVEGLGKKGKSSSNKFTAAMGTMAKGAAIALTVVVTAITAVTAAITNLSKSTEQYRKEQAKLNTAFLAAGSTTAQAAKSYQDLFRFLGDSQKATEAAAHLAKMTTNEKELAEWTTNLQGIYATFGDSLPVEGLAEAANESARVGKVTGTLADALNWAGVNEDAFNASLAKTNTMAEREALIRNTLNGLYSDAAVLYEKNNQEIIKQNEAQARLDATTARLGKSVTPLVTALTNLSNTLLTALGPAIVYIANVMTTVINVISKAVQWIMVFVSALTGKSASESMDDMADSASGIANGMGSASSGANSLSSGLNSAASAAQSSSARSLPWK